MASKRILKKCVNNLTFDLISECYVYSYFHKDTKTEKVDGVMEELVRMRNSMVNKINHPEYKDDKKENRKYFRGIVADMQKMVDEMDKLGAK